MIEIKISRESANDNDVTVVELNFSNGDFVKEGDIVAAVEGEKAVYEIESPSEGFITYIYQIDDVVAVDGVVAIVSENSELDTQQLLQKYKNTVSVDVASKESAEIDEGISLPGNIRKKRNISGKEKVAVIGAGLALSQVVDAAADNKNLVISCAYDDVLFGKTISSEDGIPIVGKVDIKTILKDYHDNLFDTIVVSVSTNIKFRREIFEKLNGFIPFTNIVHKSAIISATSEMGVGNIILANTVVASKAIIENNNFISSFCNIEHHCIVRSHCTFGPGVMFSGGVRVDSNTKFGTGIHVEPKVHIHDGFIKSGSVIQKK